MNREQRMMFEQVVWYLKELRQLAYRTNEGTHEEGILKERDIDDVAIQYIQTFSKVVR